MRIIKVVITTIVLHLALFVLAVLRRIFKPGAKHVVESGLEKETLEWEMAGNSDYENFERSLEKTKPVRVASDDGHLRVYADRDGVVEFESGTGYGKHIRIEDVPVCDSASLVPVCDICKGLGYYTSPKHGYLLCVCRANEVK